MDEDELIAVLEDLEDDAKSYVHGSLARARETATAEYYQIPEADENNGLSRFVTSDTQDTIEWVLPTLMKMFTGGEKAVEFAPRMPEDEDGAQQATEACNYAFYLQNNGFLVLHAAIKDALMLRNGAIAWRWEEKSVQEKQKFKEISLDELAYTIQQLEATGEVELTHAEQVSADVLDQMGQVMQPARFTVHLSVKKKRGRVKLDNIPPEDLLVYRDWTSPLLADCPYVCVLSQCTLSDIREMGFDVEAGDLGNEDETSNDAEFRAQVSGDWDKRTERNDEAMQTGQLRREWVLVDYDGDGIAERRYVVRLNGKILENEECSHVPVACGVPIMRQHRWDGLSLADVVSDIQKLNTEVTRQMLNSLYFSVTPRNRVLTDAMGVPQANVDDMLNFTPGGYVREKVAGAVQPLESMFVGAQAFPMLEYIGKMRQDRTGVNQYFQGNSTDALNKTASGTAMLTQQTQQRVELMARMLAETLVVPVFQGIFKLLIEYQMEPLSFRLNNKYVRFDPQEWRDQYDLVINVGLGTGNKDQILMHLRNMQALQMQMMQIGVAGTNGPMVGPKNLHALAEKMAMNSGFSAPEIFFNDPGDPIPPQPAAPPPEIVKTQMTLQADAQKTQAQMQADERLKAAEQDFEARRIMAEQAHQKEMEILRAQLQAQTAEVEEQRQVRMVGYQHEMTETSTTRKEAAARDHEIRTRLLDMHPEIAAAYLPTGEVRSVANALDAVAENQRMTAAVLAELVAEKSAPVTVTLQKDANNRTVGAVASRDKGTL